MNRNKQICLNRSVLEFMDAEITPESIVLELGSGWSSLWFARRCGELFTVETHPQWVRLVEKELKGSGLKNWHMIKCCVDWGTYQAKVENGYFYDFETVDLALIDCVEILRMEAADTAETLVKPGGVILFDDAQRPRHAQAVSWLTDKLGTPVRLKWSEGDVESAKERLTLAWRKPSA